MHDGDKNALRTPSCVQYNNHASLDIKNSTYAIGILTRPAQSPSLTLSEYHDIAQGVGKPLICHILTKLNVWRTNIIPLQIRWNGYKQSIVMLA